MTSRPPTLIVLGAGVAGLSTALYLQRSGQQVLVIDPLPPAGGTSYGNAGLISSDTASSQAFAASSPAQFVAATNAASFAGAIQITTKNIVFDPACVSAVPPAQPRGVAIQPIA